MNDEQLMKNLRSMGMECFVTYFYEFSDPSIDAVAILKRDRGYTEGSCRNRTSRAHRIIRAGRANDALTIISQASLVSPQTVRRAKELLDSKF